jgi:hypothetical protein
MNGTYQISAAGTDQFTVTADPSSCEGYEEGATGNCSDPLEAYISKQNISWESE